MEVGSSRSFANIGGWKAGGEKEEEEEEFLFEEEIEI